MSINEQLAGGKQPQDPIPGYKLVERIGRGGYGEVWKALAPGGVSKAIKLIYGDDSTRMATELRALNRVKDVRHPFLLSIERIEQCDQMLAIVTELGDKNLQQHFQACRAAGQPGVPQADLLGMLRDVADVLDFIYQEFSLQHLDIKPANLLLFGKRLKVADFGLVKNIYERSASLVHGLTPTYAAPEIFEGQPTRASDQYSLAILYQEMLTGILPFNGSTAARLATQHLREAPDLRPLPAAQQPIIARALSKDPQQRFGSCMELVEELAAVVRRNPSTKPELSLVKESLVQGSASGAPATPTAAVAAAVVSTQPAVVAINTQQPATPAESPSGMGGGAPTIVIGIGGTAGKALQRLRVRINDRIGSVTSIPHFKLLFLDVDQDSLNEINRDQQAWSELETVPTPLRSSAEYREQGHLHRRWLSRRWLFNVPRNLRTDGLRPLGRLALMSNTSKVLSAIRGAIAAVTAAGADGRPAAAPRVLLVASISGGTGSGMLLDLAYTARQEMQNAGYPEGTVEGVLLHSSPVGTGRDKAILNAVATLRELEHYGAPGSFYPGETLLKTPPFHGNNRTFARTQLLHLGDDLETSDWLRAVEHVAEHLYCRLLTPLDQALGTQPPSTAGEQPTLEMVQLRQIGGYSGTFVNELTRQLCIDVLDDWCGSDLEPQIGDGRTTPAATMVLNAMENSQSARYKQLASVAERQIGQCGIDLQPMLDRAREALLQELTKATRDYLQAQVQDAIQAVPEKTPDHELAGLVLAMQDRAIGLDFGERPQQQARNTLFDLLQSRLASQAMQMTSRFVAWIGELIDQPGMGVDAARVAAESGRECLRELISGLAKEIQQLQGRQTHSRIALTSPPTPEEAARSNRGWLLRRGNVRAAITEKLLQHGESSFEELLDVLVQSQLRSIEAQVSGVIDQLLSMWQELKQLGKRMAQASIAAGPDTGVPSGYEQSLRKWLVEHRPKLVQELRARIERDVFPGAKKLQRFLQQPGSYEQALGTPLREHARQVVLHSMQQILGHVLQERSSRLEDTDLQIDAALGEMFHEPWTMNIGGAERRVLVVPTEAGATSYPLQTPAGPVTLPLIAANTNSVAFYRERRQADIPGVMREITHGQENLIAVAANLHTRIDVAWENTAGEAVAPFAASSGSAPAEWEPVPQTVPLEACALNASHGD